MSIRRIIISVCFVLVLMLGLYGCVKVISLIVYGDDPFHPHFAEESRKEIGSLAGTEQKVKIFGVYIEYPPVPIREHAVWEFYCSDDVEKVKEIVYGTLLDRCNETVEDKPLKSDVVYYADVAFHNDYSGGGEFIIIETNNGYELKYYKEEESTYAEWIAEVTNTPLGTILNTPRAK